MWQDEDSEFEDMEEDRGGLALPGEKQQQKQPPLLQIRPTSKQQLQIHQSKQTQPQQSQPQPLQQQSQQQQQQQQKQHQTSKLAQSSQVAPKRLKTTSLVMPTTKSRARAPIRPLPRKFITCSIDSLSFYLLSFYLSV